MSFNWPKRLVITSVTLVILTSLAGRTYADSQADSNRDVQRTFARPSVWKTFSRRIRAHVEEQKKTLEYIQGKRSAEY